MIAAFMRDDVMLAPPTLRCLELLCEVRDIDDAMAVAGQQSLQPICPELVQNDERLMLTLPGDAQHSIPQRRVAGATRFVLVDGKFLSQDE